MTMMNSLESPDFTRKSWTLAGILALWGVAVAVLAQTGVYRDVLAPLVGPIIAAGMALPFVAYFSVAGFRRYIEAIGLRRLTAFHVWRTPAALLFFWYGAHDWLPEAFVRDAGWGDVGAGVFALIVTLLPSRGRYFAFHLYGLADLALALGTGMTLTLHGDPRMAGILTLPMALIPLYAVGILGATHLMAFDLLRRDVGMREALKSKSTFSNATM
jgi:hypothetical protein